MSTVESIARPRRNGERRRAPTASISKESPAITRSEERFSRNAETDLVCRLLLEKKKDQFMHIVNKNRIFWEEFSIIRNFLSNTYYACTMFLCDDICNLSF